MAAAAVASVGFNIKTQAAYTISLGDTLSKSANTRQFAGVRYNFKPQIKSDETSESLINTINDEGELELSFKNDDGAYEYSGRDLRDEESFVLVLKGQGKEQEMTLERLDRCYGFDITKTPAEGNGAKLSKRYPPLPLTDGDENGDDLFGDEDEEAPVDDDNPFDFRHFLKTELDKLENNKATSNGDASSAGTPLVRPQASGKLTSTTKQAKRAELRKTSTAAKRKAAAADKPKPNPKRVKAGPEPQVPHETSKPKPQSVPEVRVDRRASVRRPASPDEPDELILENEPSDDRSRKPTSIAKAFSGQLGPISLRSAASSPASRVESPAAAHPAGMEEEYTFDLGSSPDASTHEADGEEDEEDEDDEVEDDDADADVPDFDLPSPKNPAGQKGEGDGGAPAAAAEEDDDDELEKQLAEAMDAEMSGMFGGEESDEESEEE